MELRMDTAVDDAVIRAILFSQVIDLNFDKYSGALLWFLIYCFSLLEKWLKSKHAKLLKIHVKNLFSFDGFVQPFPQIPSGFFYS
ncbi:Uncharacterised protein [Legionella israelensis]|uniref:Uncharacterized protein n=1 Tax=Legionella israelensis TaxID=454 RepID=A0A0W0WNW1_9GAMM|nr:hypothetical protein Lisr_0198 [Legionella israelensis]SCX84670.1 hypothetical protein SAMN02746069_00421 [Legionella israelensis DSM 19235]STX57599.1 Uncharacterised protein [Legionella israelensis]